MNTKENHRRSHRFTKEDAAKSRQAGRTEKSGWNPKQSMADNPYRNPNGTLSFQIGLWVHLNRMSVAGVSGNPGEGVGRGVIGLTLGKGGRRRHRKQT